MLETIQKNWYKTSFRRNLVDMHIDDWNEAFLSKFDPQAYYDCLKAGRIKSPMLYLQSHVGLCNWPTASGKMHAGFRGENKMRRLVDLCHDGGMDVVGYYSLIYNNWAYKQHPEWRMRHADGSDSRSRGMPGFMQGGRYGLVCPNNHDYRRFVFVQLAELLEAYPIEGIFLDMTFWPQLCYCDLCTKRFREETGHDIPTRVDWADPVMQLFQQKREAWLTEFARVVSAELNRLQPNLTIEHQLSTIQQHWKFGVVEGICDASDYAGGDLYGGHQQEAFTCKLYYELSKNQPFEYMTSRCDPGLFDHTTTKSADSLRLHNLLTAAHHGAMLFIDAIDPVGTLNPKVYEAIGKVFEESMPYEKYMVGKMVADTAIYFSLNSKMNILANPDEDDCSNPQLDSAIGAAIALSTHRFLHTVIPSSHPERIQDKKVVILCEAAFLTDEEIEGFEAYVTGGGNLLITGNTAPALAKRLLGIEIQGITDEVITYIAPTPSGLALFGDQYTADYPLAVQNVQLKAENPRGNTVLATITLPWTNPTNKSVFAAIHSNPPGIATDMPSLVLGTVGKGKVLWSASTFERNPQTAHRDVFANLVRMLYADEPLLSSTAPEFVQFTLFSDEEKNCLYLSAVNVQEMTSILPVGHFSVSLRTDKTVKEVHLLPDETTVSFISGEGHLSFDVNTLDILRMYRITFYSQK